MKYARISRFFCTLMKRRYVIYLSLIYRYNVGTISLTRRYSRCQVYVILQHRVRKRYTRHLQWTSARRLRAISF